MRPVLPIALLLTACGSPAEEMEGALRISNDALAFALLASEGAAWVDAQEPTRGDGTADWPSNPGLRHGAPSDCPTIKREDGTDGQFDLEAVYPGCVSQSELVPAVLGGSLFLAGDTDTVVFDYSGLNVGNTRIAAGALSGTREATIEQWRLSGTIDLPETALLAAASAEYHLSIDHTVVDEVTFDGHIEVDTESGKHRVDLDGVRIELEDIPGECAVPNAGTARIEGQPELTVFYRNADKDGKVTVQRKSRTSTPTRLCSFASDVL